MSNTVINWRFWAYHLQVLRWSDWRWNVRENGWPVRWSLNRAHLKGGVCRSEPGWRPVAFYEGSEYLPVPVLLIALAIWAAL